MLLLIVYGRQKRHVDCVVVKIDQYLFAAFIAWIFFCQPMHVRYNYTDYNGQ